MNDWGWAAPAEWGWIWVPAVLVLLYLFRPRHRPQKVAAAFLWRQVGDRLGGQSLWRRLQNQRLLWLQLLICALAIAALMRPFQVRPGLVARQVVLVVDTSASMMAGDPPRLQTVLELGRNIVTQAPNGTEFLLATLDRDLLMVQPFTQDRATLLAHLRTIRPRALRGQDSRVVPFVASLLKTNPQAQVHWFSDHPLQGVDCIPHLADQGRINYAIESFQSGPEMLFLALKNYHQQAAQVRLRVSAPGGFMVERACALRGRGRQLLQISLASASGGPYQADLLSPDDMALDNRAFCLDADRSHQRLLSHGQVPVFLEQAAMAASGAPLLRVPGDTTVEGIHLWDQLPESPPAGLQIAARAPDSWVESTPVDDEGGLLLTPELQQAWSFRVASQRWGKRRRLRNSLTGVTPVLVNAQGEPLLIQRGQALVWLFPLAQSDLPLSPELPVVLSGWLHSQPQANPNPNSLLCDNRIQLPGPGPLQLRGPRGSEVLSGDQRQLEWSPSWPGLYHFTGPEAADHLLAVNFHSPEESDLDLPHKVAPPNPSTDRPELQTRPMSQDYSLPMVALALLLLLLEYRFWWGSKPRC